MKKRALSFLLLLLALVVIVPGAFAATADLTWPLSATYNEDGSTIPPASKAQIVSTWSMASSAAGPWTTIYTSAPGETAKTGVPVTVTVGTTYYFRYTCTLNGKISVPSDPVTASLDYLTPAKPGIGNVILHP